MASYGISPSSPSQLVLGFDIPLFTDFLSVFNDENFGYSSTTIDLFRNTSDKSDSLEIIAQPNPFYRARYQSEVDSDKGRANRFISAAKEDNQRFPYPTIRVFIFK